MNSEKQIEIKLTEAELNALIDLAFRSHATRQTSLEDSILLEKLLRERDGAIYREHNCSAFADGL